MYVVMLLLLCCPPSSITMGIKIGMRVFVGMRWDGLETLVGCRLIDPGNPGQGYCRK